MRNAGIATAWSVPTGPFASQLRRAGAGPVGTGEDVNERASRDFLEAVQAFFN